MNIGKSFINLMSKGALMLVMFVMTHSVFAKDLLVTALDGDVKDTFSSDAKFWIIFILIDIVGATALAVAARNPKVFFGVFFIAFIPGALLKIFVFH
ncbi:MAG: hypothetical protein QM652_05200 [Legionella sp.]|uniref:hypothetical protein n=1 Tax=Legionella sp. TaxID=459 RepID=UPI0039E2F45E